MKSVEGFLTNLHRGLPKPVAHYFHNDLPMDIEFAASRGLKLMPLRGVSRFASAARPRFEYPTSDIVHLRSFGAGSAVSWAMATDDEVMVLEYNPAIGRHSLCELCDGDWEAWHNTLQFRSGSALNATQFLLFRHAGRRLRSLGSRSAGICIHAYGDMVVVPPSRPRGGPKLSWSNTSGIQEVPWWLVNPECADENLSLRRLAA